MPVRQLPSPPASRAAGASGQARPAAQPAQGAAPSAQLLASRSEAISGRKPGDALHAEAMSVGQWSSAACGDPGWPTKVVELRDDMAQADVDDLVRPLLRLGPEGERLHVTVLPMKAAEYITGVMVSMLPPGLRTTRRVVLEPEQADPIVKRELPSIHLFTQSGQGPLRAMHSLGAFITSHFVMLQKWQQGLAEHLDDAQSQGPTATIHLMKTSDGWTNIFFRDINGKRHIVLRVRGGMVITASAHLLHVVSHGVLPESASNQYTLMIRGPLRQEMLCEFHKLLVDAVHAVAAHQAMRTLMSGIGADVTQSVLGGGGRAALPIVSKDEVRPGPTRYSLLEGISANVGRRSASMAALPFVRLDLVEMDGTEKTDVCLGQGTTLSRGDNAPLYLKQRLKSLIGMLLMIDGFYL